MRDHDERHEESRGAIWRAPGCHPEADPAVADALAQLHDGLDAVAALSLTGLHDGAVTRLLDGLTTAMARVTAVTARVGAEADRRRLGDVVGARHTAHWWASRTRLTRGECGRLVRLGRTLDRDLHAPVREALTAGRIHTDQADVIARAVDDLPRDLVDEALRSQARDVLLDDAADHDARALRILGRRILDVVAPEIGETHEQRALEQEEGAAAARASFMMIDDGHGRCHGRFSLPSLHGALLRTHLYALANPRRHRGVDREDGQADVDRDEQAADEPGPVITPLLLGQALMEYVERYPADDLPDSGSTNATVTVTMSLDALLSGVGVATLDSGGRVSAGEARRLACGAGLVPAVLNGRSEVLDLGRSSRLFTLPQRRALGLRDGGCTTEGCGMPPSICHAHHDLPWSRRGPTDLANARLLCPRHHRLAHDRRYELTHAADGRVSFHRRT
jgi:Domain of unknown function (DUF222)